MYFSLQVKIKLLSRRPNDVTVHMLFLCIFIVQCEEK